MNLFRAKDEQNSSRSKQISVKRRNLKHGRETKRSRKLENFKIHLFIKTQNFNNFKKDHSAQKQEERGEEKAKTGP